MIKFKFNKQKSIEAVLYLISKSGKNSYDLYKIVKMIFEADKYHLNYYMRPVTGDHFVSMAKGIVPSKIYDLCKVEDPKAPFFKKSARIIMANRIANCEYLSESDIEALDLAFEKLNPMTFGQICERNHAENPAWGKNYLEGSSKKIAFDQLIDDPEIIDELKDISSRIII
ncbi:MAG: Panacea domain-containing protein [Bacteroidota bacterium]|nr:Panacea domain-containing protein [Bacteroidota bacterium]